MSIVFCSMFWNTVSYRLAMVSGRPHFQFVNNYKCHNCFSPNTWCNLYTIAVVRKLVCSVHAAYGRISDHGRIFRPCRPNRSHWPGCTRSSIIHTLPLARLHQEPCNSFGYNSVTPAASFPLGSCLSRLARIFLPRRSRRIGKTASKEAASRAAIKEAKPSIAFL